MVFFILRNLVPIRSQNSCQISRKLLMIDTEVGSSLHSFPVATTTAHMAYIEKQSLFIYKNLSIDQSNIQRYLVDSLLAPSCILTILSSHHQYIYFLLFFKCIFFLDRMIDGDTSLMSDNHFTGCLLHATIGDQAHNPGYVPQL